MDQNSSFAGAFIPSETPVQRDVSTLIDAAKARLAGIPNSTRAFGVIRMWPDQPVAEHENVERLKDAAELIGVKVVELDRFGRKLNSPGEFITENEVDFVLHLHFETEKTYDTVSVGALWNPFQFYQEWGFERYWAKQMSHDILATTGSEEIARIMRLERGQAVADAMPVLNHSLSKPVFSPIPRASYNAFYCGINWEKLDGRPGRHTGLLRALDDSRKIDIFGPETIRNVKVWDGYQCYRGPIPFDGKTVIRKIWQSGACLVLSSDAHKASNIMSNRLFEALAAGAVVIGDEHGFIPKAIGDNFIAIPSHLTDAKRAAIVIEALQEFENYPEKAYALAKAAQDSFLDSYFLSTQLAKMFEHVGDYKQSSLNFNALPAAPAIDFVIQFQGKKAPKIRDFVTSLQSKFGAAANILILAAPDQQQWYQDVFGDSVTVLPYIADGGKAAFAPADCLNIIAPFLKSKKISFLLGIEEIFAAPYLRACHQFADEAIGRQGHVLEHSDPKGEQCFDYQAPETSVDKFHDAAISSIVFDREWLTNVSHLRGLSWKSLVKLAELSSGNVISSSPTAVRIDSSAYEKAVEFGFKWWNLSGDEQALTNRFGTRQKMLPSGLVSRSAETLVQPKNVVYEPAPTPAVIGFESADLAKAIHKMHPAEKLQLGLGIYHSMPLPGFFKKIITVTRKIFGIR